MSFIPETLPRIVIARASGKELGKSGDADQVTPTKVNVLHEMRFVTTMTFRIMFTEPIVTFLGEYIHHFHCIAIALLIFSLRYLQWFRLWFDVLVPGWYHRCLCRQQPPKLRWRRSNLPQFRGWCLHNVRLLRSSSNISLQARPRKARCSTT